MAENTESSRLSKTFETLKQAERYQAFLYNRYYEVKLVSWPSFGEAGTYTWNVSNNR